MDMDTALDVAAACLLLAAAFQRRRTARTRRWCVRPYYQHRLERGSYQSDIVQMRSVDESLHFKYVRMSPAVFDRLLVLIEPFLPVRRQLNSATRPEITNAERLALTLRYLASGESMQNIAIQFRVGHSTAHHIIIDVCQAIWAGLVDKYMQCPSKPAEWAAVATDFYARWNFPHCIGAIDGKHINMQAPHNSGSSFYNYKNFHSIVLLAAVDAQYRFIMVDIGASGRESDGGVFSMSAFGQSLESASAGLPDATDSVPGLGQLPYFMVGDEAFPLRSYMMRPYPGKQLSIDKRIFNYRLSRARRIVENAFGILVARWRLFRQPINAKPENVVHFTKACVVLHNFLQTESSATYCPSGFIDTDVNGRVSEGFRRIDFKNGGLTDITKAASNNFTRHVKTLREQLARFFLSPAGAVSWQVDAVTEIH
ncbi:uncharacterized protein LOC135826078 [Sycon ciliatum]|uniref:uncharacterized protein LOC135826078 n=1 Tax=Sycon ciliatum TaxID=27933 RepID=UPI0031F63316